MISAWGSNTSNATVLTSENYSLTTEELDTNRYMRYLLALLVVPVLFTDSIAQPSWEYRIHDALTNFSYKVGRWRCENYVVEEGEWKKGTTLIQNYTWQLDSLVLEGTTVMQLPDGRTYDSQSLVSYDALHQVFRITTIDNFLGYLEVFEGHLSGNVFVSTNENNGISFSSEKGNVKFKTKEIKINNRHYKILHYRSLKGQKWQISGKGNCRKEIQL